MMTHLTLMFKLVFSLFLVAALVAVAGAQDNEQDDYVAGEVVLKLIQAADLPAVAADHKLDPVKLSQFGSRPIFRLSILDGMAPPDKAVALLADVRVIYAEPNFLGEAPERRGRTPWAIGGDSGDYAAQWAPALIRLPEAHTVSRGDGIIVAVLDTGIDAAHPALAGRLVAGYDFVDMDDDPGEVGVEGQDVVYGHGTHVAGIVALTAPEAGIMPVRVLDRDGVGNVWVLAEALAFAVDPDGDPTTDDGAHVINLSLSTMRQTSLLDEILTEITCAPHDNDNGHDDDDKNNGDNGCSPRVGRGTVIVAAAGNSGVSVREYPAAEEQPGLLAVAASTLSETLATFSTYGPWVQVAAPGQNILSSVPGGAFGAWSGTSMAAPFAAGQAALVLATYPDFTAAQVVNRIVASAVAITAPVPLRIDAAAALGLDADTTCQGFMGSRIVDNLSVPRNATCTLAGTEVRGNVKVEAGASLVAGGVNVGANVQAEGASLVTLLDGSTVGGSVQLKRAGAAEIDEVSVNGDVLVEVSSQVSSVTRSQVGGNVQIFRNTGGVTVADNIILGNLQCKENDPAPGGQDNQVHGNLEDQCATLGAQPQPTAPETIIRRGPDATTTSTSARFTFYSNISNATFECSLDGAAFDTCVSPVDYEDLSLGWHTFQVRAVNEGVVDPTPASYTWEVSPAPQCGAPVTLSASADTWIDQNSAAGNFGTDAILKVRSQGRKDNFRVLVRFTQPVTPEGCVVESAVLHLYAASATPDRTLQAIRIAGDWWERRVTWSNQPQTAGAAATTNSGYGYLEWDVTAQVQAMIDTGINHDFLIRDADEGGNGFEQQFHSREKGENPPILVITFSPAGE